MRYRFSLRFLLATFGLMVVFGTWRCQPRRNAEQFKSLIQAANFTAADAMFVDDLDQIIATFAYFPENRIEVRSISQTTRQWLRGVCAVTLVFHRPGGVMVGSGVESLIVCVAADARGLKQFGSMPSAHAAREHFERLL